MVEALRQFGNNVPHSHDTADFKINVVVNCKRKNAFERAALERDLSRTSSDKKLTKVS